MENFLLNCSLQFLTPKRPSKYYHNGGGRPVINMMNNNNLPISSTSHFPNTSSNNNNRRTIGLPVRMGLKTMTMTAERPRLLRLAPNTSNQKQQQEGDRLFFMMKSACLCPHCSLVIHEPVILPCGHTVCRHCSDDLLQKTNNKMVDYKNNSRRHIIIPFPTQHSSDSMMPTAYTPPQQRLLEKGEQNLGHRSSKPLRIRMGVRSLVRRQQMMDNEDDGKMAPPRPPKRSWHLSSRGISLTVNEEEEEEECDEEEGSEAEAPSTPLNIPPIHSNNNNHDDPSRPKEFTMLQVGERPVKSLLLPNPAAVSFKSPKCPACGALPCTIPPVPNILLEKILQMLLDGAQQPSSPPPPPPPVTGCFYHQPSHNHNVPTTTTTIATTDLTTHQNQQQQERHLHLHKAEASVESGGGTTASGERSPTPSCGSSGSSGFCDDEQRPPPKAEADKTEEKSEVESAAVNEDSETPLHNVSSTSTKYSASSLPGVSLARNRRKEEEKDSNESTTSHFHAADRGENHEEPAGGLAHNDDLLRVIKIAIVGGKGVGKTQLMATQCLNNLFFGEISEDSESGGSPPSGASESAARERELRAKFRLSILDNDNIQGLIREADGIVLAYSIADRSSLDTVNRLFQEIRLRRSDNPPMIVVGTKSDLRLDKNCRRLSLVSIVRGQTIADALKCPFIEVSSKFNHKINEIFCQLIQTIDARSADRKQWQRF